MDDLKATASQIENSNISYNGLVVLFREFGIEFSATPDTQEVQIAIALKRVQENQMLGKFKSVIENISTDSNRDFSSNLEQIIGQLNDLSIAFEKISQSQLSRNPDDAVNQMSDASQLIAITNQRLNSAIVVINEIQSSLKNWAYVIAGVFGSLLVGLIFVPFDGLKKTDLIISIIFGSICLIFIIILLFSLAKKAEKVIRKIENNS